MTYEECIKGIKDVTDRVLESGNTEEIAETKVFWLELENMGRAEEASDYFTSESLREMAEAINNSKKV